MKRFNQISMLIAVISSLVITSAAQNGNHVLRGRIYLPNQYVASRAIAVKLTNNAAVMAEVYTDATGTYTFTGIANGRYEIVVESDEQTYERTVVSVEIFSLTDGSSEGTQFFTQNIHLITKTKKIEPAGVISPQQSIPKEAKKKYQQGIKYAQTGRSVGAIEQFQQALNIYPEYYQAYLALGQEYTKTREFSAAESNLQSAIKLRPKMATAYLSLGMLWVKNGQYEQALPILRQAFSLGEQGMATCMFLGVALMEEGNREEAERMLLQAQRLSGESQPQVRLILADFYQRGGARSKMLEQLDAYLREAPDSLKAKEVEQLIKRVRTQP